MLLETVARDGGFDLENLREHWMDAILECNAPFYGEVVTLYEPLACYRVHGRNLYAVNSINDTHFNLLLHTFEIKLDYFARRCQAWGIPFNLAAVRARSPWALECELILSKLASGARPTKKHIFTRLYLLIKHYIGGPMPLGQRILRTGWIFGVLVGPKPIARRLIAFRFVASQRPAYLQRFLYAPLLRRAGF
jgi:hypothetical protein